MIIPVWLKVNMVFVLLSACGYLAHAQESKPDSVLNLVQDCKTSAGLDTMKLIQAGNLIAYSKFDDKAISEIENSIIFLKEEYNNWYYWMKLNLYYGLVYSREFEKAIAYCQKSINEIDMLESESSKIMRFPFLSELRLAFRNSNNIPAGFNFYTEKLKDFQQQNDSTGISICYFVFGGFYRSIGLIEYAIYNYKKAISYIDTAFYYSRSITTLQYLAGIRAWINHTAVLGQLCIDAGKYEESLRYSYSALKSIFNNSKADKNDPIISFCAFSIALAKILLHQRDSVPYYLAMADSAADQTQTYSNKAFALQVYGLYFIHEQKLNLAEEKLMDEKKLMIQKGLLVNSEAGILSPDYFLARIRISQNKFKEAIALLHTDISGLYNLRSEKLRDIRLLAHAYKLNGEFKKSSYYFESAAALQDSILAGQEKHRSASFEIEQKIKESENSLIKITNEKKIASLTRNYFIGISSLLFLLAGLFFRQRNKIKKGKKISDELLLNILPSETAEELKNKGTTTAKNFDEVTIMFTDFKNFTFISEKMNAQELVNEINYCYSAFDNIITRHGIEKIKTIGDSYMCAGGLPVANTTHAEDVVKAALDIQQFMKLHLQQRKAADQEVFEIRIGIHTGPVVAGVVGVKKYAYDIWGDTVNIASRMESSSEPGKINISGATYALVSDKFKCEHRGKISAKNKGEIDMFFVET